MLCSIIMRILVIVCMICPTSLLSKKQRRGKTALTVNQPAVLTSDEQKANQARLARKERRKAHCKKFFSSLLAACLQAAQTVISREVSHLFEKMPRLIEKVGQTSARHRNLQVLDKDSLVSNIADFIQELMGMLDTVYSDYMIQGYHLTILATLKNKEEVGKYVKTVYDKGQETHLLEELFFGCCTLLMPSDRERIEHYYYSQYVKK